MAKPRVGYTAPIGSLDYPADEEPIWPCPDCLPWHVEVVADPQDGTVVVREWHAVDCPTFAAALADDDPDPDPDVTGAP